MTPQEKDTLMKRLLIATTALTLLVAPLSEAFAQGGYQGHNNDRHDNGRSNSMMMHRDNDRHDNGYRHHDWRKGGRIDRSDWNRGQRVSDYRRYHLQRPPRGYEWRRVDNNYVLAAAATGLIMGLVLANQ
jgi:Ni/Co efflux regulator RcnB